MSTEPFEWPTRVWEPTQHDNGRPVRWASRAPTPEDYKRRREVEQEHRGRQP